MPMPRSESPGTDCYVVGDALAQLEALDEDSAAVVCLDDAWARPKRGNAFGVEYPTHSFEDTKTIIDECRRVLEAGGWLIADADDWLLPKLTAYLIDEWGNAAETYGAGYRKTGRVTLLSSDGTPDRSTPGQYLSTGGYPVVFAHVGETDRRCPASASQLADRPRERHGWGSVKPIKPYRNWIEGLTEPGERVVIPCAGTAPAAIAAEQTGREWLAIDCEPEAYEAFESRREAAQTKVWVRGHTGSDRGDYHTDRNCSRLGLIEDPVQKPMTLVEDVREECDECANGPPSNTDQDHSYQQALQQAAGER